MIIPSDHKRKEEKIKFIADTCLDSQSERYNTYQYRRSYFLFGSSDERAQRVLYNRLQAHTDLVASFLFSADHAEFEIAAPRNEDPQIVAQCLAATEDWNDEFRDSGLAYQVSEAILWSLIYDSMFIKLGWNEERETLTSILVPPYNFGVYDESESELGNQHAFTHTYTIDYDEACQRLMRGGLAHRIPELQAATQDEKPTLPQPLSLMLSNVQRQHVTDPVIGRVATDWVRSYNYQAQYDTTRVRFSEVWVWDDEAEEEDGKMSGDYRRFVMMEPGILLEDSRETIAVREKVGLKSSRNRIDKDSLRWTDTNDFIPGEHPFGHIRPYSIYDYFFGECHTERLIPLQDWTTTRLSEIHEILEMQVDPPRVFAGFLGLTDEKADALHGPGTWVNDMNPGAKVDRMVPEMPEDLFAELKAIGELFLEASGLTKTISGQEAHGIRGGEHAKQAATTGSSRIKKTAVGLEPQLISIADTAMRLRQQKDPRLLITDSNMRFHLSQLATQNWKMRVSGHSHSPLFADEGRTTAGMLLKAQSIDREAYLRLMHPPGESNLIHSLRQRVKRERQMVQRNPQLIQGGKGKHPLAAAG